LPVIACLVVAPSRSQDCSVEKMDNTIININLALSQGVRGAEPVYASSPGACTRACCSGEALPGDKKCNLMIFDARRTSMHPNCYLFYCPSAAACPTKPAMGLVSYKITRDIQALEDTAFKDGYSLSFGAGDLTSRSPVSQLNRTAAWPQSDFHLAPELPNHVAKQVDSREFRTGSPIMQGQKYPESFESAPWQKVNNWLPTKASVSVGTGSPSAVLLMTRPSVPKASSATATPLPASVTRLQSRTSSLPAAAATPGALATATVTFLPSAGPGSPAARTAATRAPLSSPGTSTTAAKWVTTNGSTEPRWRGAATPWTPAAVSSSDNSHVTLLSSDLTLPSNESPRAFQNTHQGFEPSDSRSYLLEGLLRQEDVLRLGEKSSLVAALFLGVIFLLLVITLTGKKVHESLQKRRYTRLDYLINGMYADV
ncbi:MANS1 protein, partial [Nothocercus nigrocapillus]|nr:MANS1 protein [Nothocercus nigrocapillus]